jgi:hypothetical protein
MRRGMWLIAGAALLLSLAVPAAAHDKAYKTRVTIEHPSEPNYEGDVISRSRACVRRRDVQFWLDNPGSTPDQLVGTVEADREGHWQFAFIGPQYYAKVKRIVKAPGRHRHVCKRDRSPTV